MTKRCPSAVLIDGRWHLTQRSTEIAVERLLRHGERNRIKREETREMLRRERPELFAHLPTPAELPTETPPARSEESQSTLWQYQKKD